MDVRETDVLSGHREMLRTREALVSSVTAIVVRVEITASEREIASAQAERRGVGGVSQACATLARLTEAWYRGSPATLASATNVEERRHEREEKLPLCEDSLLLLLLLLRAVKRSERETAEGRQVGTAPRAQAAV